MAFRPWKTTTQHPEAKLVAICPTATPGRGSATAWCWRPSTSRPSTSGTKSREKRESLLPRLQASGRSQTVSFASAYGESGQQHRLKKDLRKLLEKAGALDTTTNRLDLQTFLRCLKEEHFQKVVSEFGVQPHRARHAFKLMDKGGSGEITIDEFVEGMVHFKMSTLQSGEELDLKTLKEMLERRNAKLNKYELDEESSLTVSNTFHGKVKARRHSAPAPLDAVAADSGVCIGDYLQNARTRTK